METGKSKCVWCNKDFEQKKWEKRTGILKGETMVSSVCCSSSCSKKLHKSLKLASLLQDFDEAKEKIQKEFNELNDSRFK